MIGGTGATPPKEAKETMPDRISDIERSFEGIILQHCADKDGGTAGYIHVLGWLQSAATEDQRIIRELLLDHVRAGTPRKWDIALAVLASDAAPGAAAQLETIARSSEERSLWRDSIILSLARMAHPPALDLCLEGLRAGPGFQADSFGLLANLIRLEPEVALNAALAYFVEEADSSEQRRERAESRSWVFFTVYSSVNPDYSLEIIRRAMGVSSECLGAVDWRVVDVVQRYAYACLVVQRFAHALRPSR